VPARASPAGNGGTLDDAAGRQNNASGAERGDNRRGDRLPALGAPGSLSDRVDHHRQIGVRRRPKPQHCGEKPRVVGHRLRASCISDERGRRNLELPGQPIDKRFDRLLKVRQGNSRVAKEGELNGEADPVGIPPTCRHELLVGARQGEALRHAVGIKGNADKSSALLVGQ
jgi:hypothetical protein